MFLLQNSVSLHFILLRSTGIRQQPEVPFPGVRQQPPAPFPGIRHHEKDSPASSLLADSSAPPYTSVPLPNDASRVAPTRPPPLFPLSSSNSSSHSSRSSGPFECVNSLRRRNSDLLLRSHPSSITHASLRRSSSFVLLGSLRQPPSRPAPSPPLPLPHPPRPVGKPPSLASKVSLSGRPLPLRVPAHPPPKSINSAAPSRPKPTRPTRPPPDPTDAANMIPLRSASPSRQFFMKTKTEYH